MDIQKLHLKRNSFITILSARRSGKSYLISDLAHYFLSNAKNKVDLVYMFSHTASLGTDNTYKWLDRRAILSPYIDNINTTVSNLINIQIQTKNKKSILLIFDDIDLDKQIEGINKLAVRGRHYNITTILSAQIANYAISPSIKNNTTYLFFRRLNANAIKDQIQSIVQTFEKPRDLYTYTQANIAGYKFLFYDNDSDDTTLKIIKANQHNFQYKLPAKKTTNTYKRKPGDYASVKNNNVIIY